MRHKKARKFAVVGAIVMLLVAQMFPDIAQSQITECDYDRKSPSVESARGSFRIFDFQCAEQEIQDLLKQDALSLEEKASAHMLLAAVYFEMLQDDAQRRGKTLEQFKEAFRSYRDWRGDLDIQSPEFRAIMEDAKQDIQAEANVPTQTDGATETPVVTRPPHTGSESGKGGSKKWLLIGLGAGAVGVAALVLAGGGGGNDNGDKTLPDFPSHPGGSK